MSMLLLTPGWLKRACAVMAFGALASPDSLACAAPPREQVVTPEEQIAMATDVSVARVVRATPLTARKGGGRQPMEYEFEVVQRIFGPNETRFVLHGAHGVSRTALPAGDHGDEAFWQRGGGRLLNDQDCVLRPDFDVGESYLVFRGKPATQRSFEHIETVRGRPNPDDKWLSYVVKKLGSR